MEKKPLLESDMNAKVKKRSQTVNLVLVNIVIFVFSLSVSFYYPLQSQYLYMRVSEEVFGNFSSGNQTQDQSCRVNISYSDPGYILEEKTQSDTAAKQMQYSILNSALAICSSVMLGASSDVIGRKLLFILPLIGHLLKYSTTAVIIFWKLDPDFFFLSEGLDGLLGGYFTVFLAAYAYTADNTSSTGVRTVGIAIVELCENIGMAASSVAAGFFIQDVGFFYPALTTALIECVAIILVVLLAQSEQVEEKGKGRSCLSPLEAIKKVFGFYTFDGEVRQRLCFIIAVCVFVTFSVPIVGVSGIDYLFKLNLPFCWSAEKIGYFNACATIVQHVVGVPLLVLLQRVCSDEIIGIIGSVGIFIYNMVKSFAYNDGLMYAGAILGIPTVFVFPVCRSILSRLAPSNKQGSLFASIAVVEMICSLVGTPLFSAIYQHTVLVWRGLVYVVTASVALLSAVNLVIFIYIRRRHLKVKNGGSIQETED